MALICLWTIGQADSGPGAQDPAGLGFTPATINIFKLKPATSGVCTVDDECVAPPYNFCNDEGKCQHKDVFPQTALEVSGIVVFSVIMALCTVAGIGGGGVTSSILMAFFNFDTKMAIAISTLSILICSCMRYIYNIKAMHPIKKEQNLIDYGIASTMMPLTLAGSQVGGYVLDMCPDIIVQTLLTLLLAFLSFRTFQKGIQVHRKEKAIEEAGGLDENEVRKSLIESIRNSMQPPGTPISPVQSQTTKIEEIFEEGDDSRVKNINQTLSDTQIGLLSKSQFGDGPIFFDIGSAGQMQVRDGFPPSGS